MTAKLQNLLPHHTYSTINDSNHAPYGERGYDDIRQLTIRAIQPILNHDLVVLACNTATAAAIDYLRITYPNKTFVGFEPMIKPASSVSKTKHITLLATQATAHSKRTKQLVDSYAPDFKIDYINTYNWAHMIDTERVDSIDLKDVEDSVSSGSDTLIIGCTHYIALIPRLSEMFPNLNILEPTEAVARRIESLSKELQQQQ